MLLCLLLVCYATSSFSPFVMAKTNSKLPTDEHFPHPLDGLRAPHLKLHTPDCIHRYGETTRDISGEVRPDEMGERPRHFNMSLPSSV